MADSLVDVLVIGGGPAGLTTALTLARQLHSCVVFDSGSYRNEKSLFMHTVPTWDHKDPRDFREAAKANILDRYNTVKFENVEVKTVKQGDGGHFVAVDANGKEWKGRKVVLATGAVDVFPEIDGYADCWVKGIFHCLFCHGFEERHSKSSGVLAVGDLANAVPVLHVARNALQLTPEKVTIYTNGSTELESDLTSQISASSVTNLRVDSRAIARLEKGPSGAQVIVHLSDGSSVTEGFLAHMPKTALKSDLGKQLGLDTTPQGDIMASPPFFQTSLRGVFAAGDLGHPIKVASNAIFMGAAAGAGVCAQVQADLSGMKGMI